MTSLFILEVEGAFLSSEIQTEQKLGLAAILCGNETISVTNLSPVMPESGTVFKVEIPMQGMRPGQRIADQPDW